MAITASMVKELRELTGAGMMDCKKALTETNGDMDAAVEVLKKSGVSNELNSIRVRHNNPCFNTRVQQRKRLSIVNKCR